MERRITRPEETAYQRYCALFSKRLTNLHYSRNDGTLYGSIESKPCSDLEEILDIMLPSIADVTRNDRVALFPILTMALSKLLEPRESLAPLDYGYGFITPKLTKLILEKGRNHRIQLTTLSEALQEVYGHFDNLEGSNLFGPAEHLGQTLLLYGSSDDLKQFILEHTAKEVTIRHDIKHL